MRSRGFLASSCQSAQRAQPKGQMTDGRGLKAACGGPGRLFLPFRAFRDIMRKETEGLLERRGAAGLAAAKSDVLRVTVFVRGSAAVCSYFRHDRNRRRLRAKVSGSCRQGHSRVQCNDVKLPRTACPGWAERRRIPNYKNEASSRAESGVKRYQQHRLGQAPTGAVGQTTWCDCSPYCARGEQCCRERSMNDSR